MLWDFENLPRASSFLYRGQGGSVVGFGGHLEDQLASWIIPRSHYYITVQVLNDRSAHVCAG